MAHSVPDFVAITTGVGQAKHKCKDRRGRRGPLSGRERVLQYAGC